MGRIDVMVRDDLERKLRVEVAKRLGGKKGDLSKAIEEAIERWVEKPTEKRNQ